MVKMTAEILRVKRKTIKIIITLCKNIRARKMVPMLLGANRLTVHPNRSLVLMRLISVRDSQSEATAQKCTYLCIFRRGGCSNDSPCTPRTDNLSKIPTKIAHKIHAYFWWDAVALFSVGK